MPEPAQTPPAPFAAPDALPLNVPASKTDLFFSFTWLALQGFGGVLAVVQRELVEKKRWMTRDEFLEDWAVAQIMPGPNVINLAMMIGGRYFGLPGALAALAGMITAPMVLVLMLAVLYGNVADNPVAQNALRGMGAVAAGLITATGIKLIAALERNAMGQWVCIGLVTVSFVAVALLRWPLLWVLLGVGGSACVYAYRVLSDVDADRRQRESAP